MEDIINWLAGDNSTTTPKTSSKQSPIQKAHQTQLLHQKRLQSENTYSGLLLFDEAHKAKNLESDTRTAKLVLLLQQRLPNARVLYCSATGVSDIKHMAYATRLGLWGVSNPLYPTFEGFRSALEKRGVGAMEMLALEMKRKGMFMARTLSWEGARFDALEIKLSKRQVCMYNNAVLWWNRLKKEILEALEFLKVGGGKVLWRAYWSAHQRFFREMCICAKVEEITEQAKIYLQKGFAIVIGLQSTGEAGLEVAMQDIADSVVSSSQQGAKKVPHRNHNKNVGGGVNYEELELPSLISTCVSIMTNVVRNHFPVALPPPDLPKVPPIPPNGFATEFDRGEYFRLSAEVERIKALPPPLPIPELVERRRLILEAIDLLDLPPNPLDDIIDRLGGVENVAELTGRSARIVRNFKNGTYRYVKRLGAPKQKSYGLSMPGCSDDADRKNIIEKKKFMDGQKSVSIISDAASTGISLHADRRCKSCHKRRVHFTIELPWAADKAIQQLGRSHRSGQASAPIYKMVVTSLGGERRFAAAVSKRMANLGALTKGDRRAATGTDLSEFDIDSVFGRRALHRVYTCLRAFPPTMAPSRNSNVVLDSFIATSEDVEIVTSVRKKDVDIQRRFALLAASKGLEEVGLFDRDVSVKVFLNRIAGLDVSRQNLVFSLFMSTLDDVITDAKATGEFEGSVEDVKATNIMMSGRPEVIATDVDGSQPTMLTKIKLDRGISFHDMVETMIREEGSSAKDGFEKENNDDEDVYRQTAKSGFYISKRKIAGRFLIMYARRKVDGSIDDNDKNLDPLGLMIISRPNTGKNPCEMRSRDLHYKYRLIISSSDLLLLLSGNKKSPAQDSPDINIESERKNTTDDVKKVCEHYPKLFKIWDMAYSESNRTEHHLGLAPRISYMGLVTGAVLHVLPVLEKAVLFLRQSQRSLRVMRVELTGSGQRLVGIRFPLENEALAKLKILLNQNALALNSRTLSFIDEKFLPIDEKAMKLATTPQKTMKNYFGAVSAQNSSNNGVRKRKDPPSAPPQSFKYTDCRKKAKKSQTKTIASFFGKKT